MGKLKQIQKNEVLRKLRFKNFIVDVKPSKAVLATQQSKSCCSNYILSIFYTPLKR